MAIQWIVKGNFLMQIVKWFLIFIDVLMASNNENGNLMGFLVNAIKLFYGQNLS